MKLAIDCTSLRKKPSGIPNFLVASINAIVQQNPTWEIYLLSNESFDKEYAKLLNLEGNIRIVICPLPFLKNIAFLWLLLKVKSVLNQIKPDLYWAPALLLPPFLKSQFKTLVTVHDMVYKEFSDTMSISNRVFFHLLHDRSLKRADLLWVNSHYTKSSLYKYYPFIKNSSVFIGFFINRTVFKNLNLTKHNRDSIREKFKLRDKFLLFVGTLEPRKNLAFLLLLMPELAAKGYDLLIIGAKGWGKSDLKQVIDAENFPVDKVVFAGFVSTQELVEIYNVASVYISTSLNEGFGMPQLEAMACGCPVVTPHNSAMIEVVAGAGETVLGWQQDDWINTILKVDLLRTQYIEKGLKRVDEFRREYVICNLSKFIQNNLVFTSKS